jgi:hypothetical protein
VPNVCATPSTCTNLCLQQKTCPSNGTTSLSGTVYAPNGVDPLPNVLVYVPNSTVPAFTVGVSCDRCSSTAPGSPLVTTTTDAAGHFSLTNMPVGSNIPLVMQAGRWRRQITVPTVTACVDTPTLASSTRFPRNQSEGDIPKMAFATGSADALECLLRKVGIQDTEFTQPSGTGRIHLYVGDGGTAGGANAGAGTPSESTLVGTLSTLEQYDAVLFPCKGTAVTRSAAELKNLLDYANAGGRVFATHFSYVWLATNPPFSTTAQWNVGQTPDPANQIGFVDQSFPKGVMLSAWLQNVGSSTTAGQIILQSLKHDLAGLVAPSQQWLSIQNPSASMLYTFQAPVGQPSNQQCGRVLFNDFHVEVPGATTSGVKFPSECTAGAMTPQEKLLEFMIFELGSCVGP